jgi:hypothetical protein
MRFVDGLVGNDPNQLLNSHGHRSKEINDVNLRNYILFVGDNVGLKLDMPIEDTFPYMTANKLKIDYYNLSIFNGGIDAVKYNLFVWLSKYPPPKAIVTSCEFVNALLVSDHNNSYLNVADLTDHYIQDLNDSANNCGFFAGRNLLIDKMLSNYTSIPIYQVSIKDKLNPFSLNVINVDWDEASHEDLAQSLSTVIQLRIQRARASV